MINLNIFHVDNIKQETIMNLYIFWIELKLVQKKHDSVIGIFCKKINKLIKVILTINNKYRTYQGIWLSNEHSWRKFYILRWYQGRFLQSTVCWKQKSLKEGEELKFTQPFHTYFSGCVFSAGNNVCTHNDLFTDWE